MLKEIGRDICRAVLIYFKGSEGKCNSGNNENINIVNSMDKLNPLPEGIEKLRKEIVSDVQGRIESEIKNFNILNMDDQNPGESDSAPSDDNLDKDEIKRLLPKKTKKKNFSRMSIDSALKKKNIKEVKNIPKQKKEEKVSSSIGPPSNLSKTKVSSSLTLRKEKVNIQINDNVQSNEAKVVTNQKDPVTTVQAKNEKQASVTNLMRFPEGLLLYFPTKSDKESQTEELYFSV
jgi:hypothetical protein